MTSRAALLKFGQFRRAEEFHFGRPINYANAMLQRLSALIMIADQLVEKSNPPP